MGQYRRAATGKSTPLGSDVGDVVALVDASGATVASYSYDAFGSLTSFSESFGSGVIWTNPYRYDGRDGVRYDGETGLY